MKKKYFFHITQCTYNENESTELLNRILYEKTKYEKKTIEYDFTELHIQLRFFC